MNELHLRSLYRLLKHRGFITRMGSLDYNTKIYDEEFLNSENEVINYAKHWDSKRNIFIGRGARDKDGHVTNIHAVTFDIDPIRDKGTAATDSQHNSALAAGRKILEKYKGGYLCSSGNGCLLLYHIIDSVHNIPAFYARESKLIKELNELVKEFNVKIDSTNYDQAVIKAIGTMSTKGDPSLWRRSKFFELPIVPYKVPNSLISYIKSIDPMYTVSGLQIDVSKFQGDRSLADFHLVKYMKDAGVSMETAIEALRMNPLGRQIDQKDQARLINKLYGPNILDEEETLETFLRDIEPINWICEPIIANNTIGFVAGLPETSKTWIMIDLAIECAKGGGKWLNKFPVKGCRVMFIDQERFKGETQRRFKKVLAYKDLKAKDLELYPLCGSTIRLDLDESFNAFKNKLSKIKPQLVIIDSFATFHTKEENNRKDIQVVLERIKKLRQEFNCAFIFIDHENKSVLNPEDKEAPNAFKMIGSVGKPAAAEFILTVRKEIGNKITVYHTKSTLASTIEPFEVQVNDIKEGTEVKVI